jgi:hypothetical protein
MDPVHDGKIDGQSVVAWQASAAAPPGCVATVCASSAASTTVAACSRWLDLAVAPVALEIRGLAAQVVNRSRGTECAGDVH